MLGVAIYTLAEYWDEDEIVYLLQNSIDVIVQFDPMDYQATEGTQSVAFRITAQPPPAGEITVLFSTMDGTALGMTITLLYSHVLCN